MCILVYVGACSINLDALPFLLCFGVDGESRVDFLFWGSIAEDEVSGLLLSAAVELSPDYLYMFMCFMCFMVSFLFLPDYHRVGSSCPRLYEAELHILILCTWYGSPDCLMVSGMQA